MNTLTKTTFLIACICGTTLAVGQQRNSYNDRYNYDDDRDRYDRRELRRNDRQSERDYNSRDERSDYDRRDYNQRNDNDERYNNYNSPYRNRMSDTRPYTERDLSRAYDEGFEDGQRSMMMQEEEQEQTEARSHRQNYKYFTFGIYGGANSTRFEGESVDGKNLTGRLGYQLGFMVRGGGRVYGQIGAEYLTSSSEFYKPGDGTSTENIIGNIDQRYLHIPAYIGVKLAQSDRGVSAIRLAVGAEYATPLSTDKNDFNLGNADFQAATINGLVNLGFDAGPIMLNFVYHHGFADVLTSGNSKRRILGVNFGFKF